MTPVSLSFCQQELESAFQNRSLVLTIEGGRTDLGAWASEPWQPHLPSEDEGKKPWELAARSTHLPCNAARSDHAAPGYPEKMADPRQDLQKCAEPSWAQVNLLPQENQKQMNWVLGWYVLFAARGLLCDRGLLDVWIASKGLLVTRWHSYECDTKQ